MASTYTPSLNLEIPAHGDYSTTGWDTPADNNLRTLDTAYGGYLSIPVSAGTVALTLAQASNPIIAFTGTLSGDVVVTFPPIAGKRLLLPAVNLNGFLLYVRGNNGADPNGIYFWQGISIPYPIVVLPWRVHWDYGGCQPGTIADSAVANPGNGWLPCDGRWVNIGLHDILFDVIGSTWGVSGSGNSGSFRVPDYRGVVTAMADNIGTVPPSGVLAVNAGARNILPSAGSSWGIMGSGFPYGGEGTHTLTNAELPPEPGHVHSIYTLTAGAGALTYTGGANYTFGAVNTTLQYAYHGQALGYAHNNVQPTTTTMKVIKW